MQISLVPSKPKCKTCGRDFESRVKRSFFVKKVLFFLPFKKYKCSSCRKQVYVLSPKVKTEKQAIKSF
ncbi:hypothetical protein BDD43_1359 [Mucilaginibacter gracilis]|uniref:Uncharacterized protein n=1 Tax=Mucilaginibacter gracilis TaxID=423350 RepID=A0A495IYS5_9SPHI|nr:hypothetical protein BDD43_1359 [Mucilaginibacter gracilis]